MRQVPTGQIPRCARNDRSKRVTLSEAKNLAPREGDALSILNRYVPLPDSIANLKPQLGPVRLELASAPFCDPTLAILGESLAYEGVHVGGIRFSPLGRHANVLRIELIQTPQQHQSNFKSTTFLL